MQGEFSYWVIKLQEYLCGSSYGFLFFLEILYAFKYIAIAYIRRSAAQRASARSATTKPIAVTECYKLIRSRNLAVSRSLVVLYMIVECLFLS